MGAWNAKPAPPSRTAPLHIARPVCEWLGDGSKALVLKGAPFTINKAGVRGRGNHVGVGLSSGAVPLIWEGPDSNLVLRCASDRNLCLEVHYRTFVAGTGLSFWASSSGRARPCVFSLNADNTISPLGYSDRLVLGLNLDGESLRLVLPSDHLAIVVDRDGTGALQQQQPIGAIPVPLAPPEHAWPATSNMPPSKFAAGDVDCEDPT